MSKKPFDVGEYLVSNGWEHTDPEYNVYEWYVDGDMVVRLGMNEYYLFILFPTTVDWCDGIPNSESEFQEILESLSLI